MRLIGGTRGQTDCLPLMQSLVQQAEATNGYGSWDACCARTGSSCFLTRQMVAPGFEPCDAAHGARAGCNRVPQGTVCMIGSDGQITGSPCGAAQVRSCATTVILNGQQFNNLVSADIAPGILIGGVEGSLLCCSVNPTSCQLIWLSPCSTSQFSMTCVSDGVNAICVPFDQASDSTYAVAIQENCDMTTTLPMPSASIGPASGKKRRGVVISGVLGGSVGLICLVVVAFVTRWRTRPQRPGGRWPIQRTTGIAHTMSSQNPPATSPTIFQQFTQVQINWRAIQLRQSFQRARHSLLAGNQTSVAVRNANRMTANVDAMAERIAVLEERISSLAGEQAVREGGESAPPPYEE